MTGFGIGEAGDPPELSVCMPVFNADRYVAQAVESVLNQTFNEFELIIIDDGSSDRSVEILRSYAARDKRIRLISRPNRGVASTRNEALSMVRGRLVAMMDADDISRPERFASQLAYLETHPDVVCVGAGIMLIDEKGRRIAPFIRPEDDETLQGRALAGELLLPQPCSMIRKEAIDRVGRYDPHSMAEDVDYFLRLGEIGKLANVPQVLLEYRVHSGSISALQSEKQAESVREACRKAWRRRGIEGQLAPYRPPRASESLASRYEFALRYGWWAFNAGEWSTALAYALKGIRTAPWKTEGWLLLSRALFKPRQDRDSGVSA